MGRRRGNPAWYRGMPSANPKGRPRGQTSLAAFVQDPYFTYRHLRWWYFCCELIMAYGNGAEAARRLGYSPKSARFIASRLRKRAVIKAMLRKWREESEKAMLIRCPCCRIRILVEKPRPETLEGKVLLAKDGEEEYI